MRCGRMWVLNGLRGAVLKSARCGLIGVLYSVRWGAGREAKNIIVVAAVVPTMGTIASTSDISVPSLSIALLHCPLTELGVGRGTVRQWERGEGMEREGERERQKERECWKPPKID